MKIYPYNKDSENYSSFYSYFAEKGSKINKQEGIMEMFEEKREKRNKSKAYYFSKNIDKGIWSFDISVWRLLSNLLQLIYSNWLFSASSL